MTEHQGQAADNLADRVTAAADSIRAFNHESRAEVLPDGCLPAPDVYRIVGSAAELTNGLPQALRQIAEALHRSLTVFDIYDRDREPGESVATAIEAMTAAADAFAVAARRRSDAQNVLAVSTRTVPVTYVGARHCGWHRRNLISDSRIQRRPDSTTRQEGWSVRQVQWRIGEYHRRGFDPDAAGEPYVPVPR